MPGGPLVGVKVLDLCQFQNGPSATGQLCDNGATVIKVEPPHGDGIRHVAPPGAYFGSIESFNRGKRSIVLDLKHKDAPSIMRRLCEWADVLVSLMA
jgi:CoA:oxalate CoA-transferase